MGSRKQSLVIFDVAQLTTTPSNPAAGYGVLYPKTDGEWYSLIPDGTVKKITATFGTLAIASSKSVSFNASLSFTGTNLASLDIGGGGVLGTAAYTAADSYAVLGAANIFPTNGAVSAPSQTYNGTWYSGGTGTTTKPYFLIQTTGATSTDWSTSGTGLGINAASGFTGNLLDLQANGVSKTSIAYDGSLTTGDINFTGLYGSSWRSAGANSVLTIQGSGSNYNGTGNSQSVTIGGTTNTKTAGQFTSLAIQNTYNQASSTAANTDLLINRTETVIGSGAQKLIDAQVATVSKFSVTNAGNTSIGTTVTTSALNLAANAVIQWGNNSFLKSAGSGIWQVGFSSGSEDGQLNVNTISSIFNLYGGSASGTNIAGTDLNLRSKASTGTGVGGSIILSTTPAGSTGSSANTYIEALRITGASNVGIGAGSTVSAKLHIINTTEQLRSGYNALNYWNAITNSAGTTTFLTTGTTGGFVFSSVSSLSAGVIINSNSNVYRQTQGGSNITGINFMNDISGSTTTAGALGLATSSGTGNLDFTAANGSRRIARAGVGLSNLINTASSESADLSFYTQTGGTAYTVKLAILAAGGLDFVTSGTPAPVAGHAVLWFDGTNFKVIKNIAGSTTSAIIF